MTGPNDIQCRKRKRDDAELIKDAEFGHHILHIISGCVALFILHTIKYYTWVNVSNKTNTLVVTNMRLSA